MPRPGDDRGFDAVDTDSGEVARRVLEAQPDPVVVYRGDQLRYANPAAVELFGYSREELLATAASDLVHPADRERLREYQSRRYDAEGTPTRFEARLLTVAGEVRTCEFRVRTVRLDGGPATLATLRDVTDRARRRRELSRRRDDLDRLSRLQERLLSTTRALVRTPDRDRIFQTVCTRLVGEPLYGGVWVCRGDGERIAAAGIDESTLDTLHDAEGPIGTDSGPGERARQDNEVRVVHAPPEFAGTELTTEGALGAVPVGTDDIAENALLLYTDRHDGFNTKERSALTVFGEIVGFVVDAIENRDLLVADVTTELTFRTTSDQSLLVRAADRLGVEVELVGVVVTGSNTQHWYVRLPMVDGVESLADDDAVEEIRRVTAAEGQQELELAVRGFSLPDTLLAEGARVTTGRADANGASVTAETTADAPRGVATRVVEAFPRTELLRKGEQERPIQTEQEFHHTVKDRLTERRWVALRTAYLGGYFNWPRDSTAEAVAETLDVTPPTLHYHLRMAHQTVLDVLFEEGLRGASAERH